MLKYLAYLLLLIALPVFSASPEKSSYNKGVDAYREKNYTEARKQWTQSLAEGGPDEALNNLAFLFFNGLGGDTDEEKAVELWRKGAALGVSEAQWHLGYAYEKGKGLRRSLAYAYAWYRCAAINSGRLKASSDAESAIFDDVEEAQLKLSVRISESDKESGERLSKEFIARYSSRLSTEPPSPISK